jgi:hypothetical protein
MEGLGALLGGLGVLGILAGLFVGFLVLLFLPWWAIVDCILSPRSTGAKAVGVVFLVLTWGLGSLVYGLFLASSRALRIFTVVAVSILALVLVPSVASLLAGAGIHSRQHRELEQRERQEVAAKFRPGTIAADTPLEFRAVHFTFGDFGPATAALARFTLAGPVPADARDTDATVRHVACDEANARCFALTAHEFGTITPSSGRFARIDVDPSLGGFSWPTGIAFDRDAHDVFVMTSHVSTEFYRFDPDTADWQHLPADVRDLPLVGLALLPEDGCLYAVELRSGRPSIERIHRFNTAGASLGPIALHPPIPVPERSEPVVQLSASGGKLVLVLEPATSGILVVDPQSGEVLAPA